MLIPQHKLRHRVKGHDAVVVGASQALEEGRGDGEEGHVLDVRVVGGGVGDEVVDVVVALPPAAGEAAEEIGDQDADAAVGVEVVGYAHVAGVVHGEDELVPEQTEEDGRESEVVRAEEVEGEEGEGRVSSQFEEVGGGSCSCTGRRLLFWRRERGICG